MTKPNGKEKVMHKTAKFLQGEARNGGVISLDVSLHFGITVCQAIARLGYLVKRGDALRVGEQKLQGEPYPFKIFILTTEKDEYYESGA